MRNSVSNFQLAIKSYLDELSLIDEQFAAKYRSEEKSIEKCCAFIISEMKKLPNLMKIYNLLTTYWLFPISLWILPKKKKQKQNRLP